MYEGWIEPKYFNNKLEWIFRNKYESYFHEVIIFGLVFIEFY